MKKEFLSEEINFKKNYMISMLNMVQDMIIQLGNQIKQEMTAISESVKRIEPEEENPEKITIQDYRKTMNEIEEYYAKLHEKEQSENVSDK